MRTTTVRLAALAALLLCGAVMAAPPADPNKPAEDKKPSQLEELIAQALRDNPDIRVAEAKTREAEAELNRVRLQVIQKVVAHQHTVDTLESAVRMAEANYVAAQAKLAFAEAELKRLMALDAGVTATDRDAARAKVEQARAEVETAKSALQAAKADVAKAQAELPYLLGKGNKDDKQAEVARRNAIRLIYERSIDQAVEAWRAADLPRGSLPDKVRKALDAPVSITAENQPLDDLLKFIEDQAGVPIFGNLPPDLRAKKVTARIGNVPLGAVFQLLGDLTGAQFAVRDYGILASDKLPLGVMPLHDFWKGSDKPKAGEDKPKAGEDTPK